MLVGSLRPAAVSPTSSRTVLNGVLSELYEEVKAKVIGALRSRREAFMSMGYKGLCSLQVDMTTVVKKEDITLSTSIIGDDSGELETYSLSTRVFPGTHKEGDIVQCVREVRLVPRSGLLSKLC